MEEKETGFKGFYRLVKANQDKTFVLTYENGSVIEAVYDMDFDDNPYSKDTNLLDNDVTFKTVSMTITGVIKDPGKHYKKDDVVLINPLDGPVSAHLK